MTTQAGDDKTGHITALPNEGILFIDSKHSSVFDKSKS